MSAHEISTKLAHAAAVGADKMGTHGPDGLPDNVVSIKSVLPFDENGVNPEASLLTLFKACFEAPNACELDSNRTANFLTHVMLTVADEIRLVGGMNDGLDNSELIDRATMRADWRLRLAVEIARRLESGQGVSP